MSWLMQDWVNRRYVYVSDLSCQTYKDAVAAGPLAQSTGRYVASCDAEVIVPTDGVFVHVYWPELDLWDDYGFEPRDIIDLTTVGGYPSTSTGGTSTVNYADPATMLQIVVVLIFVALFGHGYSTGERST